MFRPGVSLILPCIVIARWLFLFQGECLGGALYWKDLAIIAQKIGFCPPRLVTADIITVENKELEGVLGKKQWQRCCDCTVDGFNWAVSFISILTEGNCSFPGVHLVSWIIAAPSVPRNQSGNRPKCPERELMAHSEENYLYSVLCARSVVCCWVLEVNPVPVCFQVTVALCLPHFASSNSLRQSQPKDAELFTMEESRDTKRN